MTTQHPNCKQIIQELDNSIASVAWQHAHSFNYRHLNLCAGVGAKSFLSSMQQYHFTDGNIPAFFEGKRPFFYQLQQLQPETTFAISHDDRWTKLQIFNFYPPLMQFLGRKLGKPLQVHVYLKHHSDAVEHLSTNQPHLIRWGYELLDKPGGPDIFLSGPGRFQFNVQLFQIDRDSGILSLYFIASERPSAIFKIFGRDRIFPFIKRVALSKSKASPLATYLVNNTESMMLGIHNRVHHELLLALCDSENCANLS